MLCLKGEGQVLPSLADGFKIELCGASHFLWGQSHLSLSIGSRKNAFSVQNSGLGCGRCNSNYLRAIDLRAMPAVAGRLFYEQNSERVSKTTWSLLLAAAPRCFLQSFYAMRWPNFYQIPRDRVPRTDAASRSEAEPSSTVYAARCDCRKAGATSQRSAASNPN